MSHNKKPAEALPVSWPVGGIALVTSLSGKGLFPTKIDRHTSGRPRATLVGVSRQLQPEPLLSILSLLPLHLFTTLLSYIQIYIHKYHSDFHLYHQIVITGPKLESLIKPNWHCCDSFTLKSLNTSNSLLVSDGALKPPGAREY